MPVGVRALLQAHELTPPERELCRRAAEARLLDLRSGDDDDPAGGGVWGPARRIRAQVVEQLLTGDGPALAAEVLAVRLRGAQVVGRLDLGARVLRCPLQLAQCRIRSRVGLAKAQAPNVDLSGSHLRRGLSARGLAVVVSLNLSSGFRSDPGVDLRLARIDGRLDCSGATVGRNGGYALNAGGAVVGDDVSLVGARCDGTVMLSGARIGGTLDCSGAELTCPGDRTFDGEGLVVGHNLYTRWIVSTGEFVLSAAHIGGQLASRGGTFVNPEAAFRPDAVAFDGEQIVVDSHLLLRETRCSGVMNLNGARLGAQLDCSGGTFDNPHGDALAAEQIVVTTAMFLSEARCSGTVDLLGAHVGSEFNCDGAVFTRRGQDCVKGGRLTVGADLFLRGVTATGTVSLLAARIDGALDLTGATLESPGAIALDLERATVAEAVFLRPHRFDGELDVTDAQVGTWIDEQGTWPSRVRVEGFRYRTIGADGTSIRDRLRWLSGAAYLPQPYEQLAEACRRAGNDEDARAVLIGKQRTRRADVQGWRRWPSRAWSAVLRWTIGYGYRPGLALIPLSVLAVVGTVLFAVAAGDPGRLHPAKPGSPEQPAFDSFRFTMDLLLPVVNFRQRDAFVPDGWAAWAAFGFTFAGWLLAAVVVVGLTGVFKRD